MAELYKPAGRRVELGLEPGAYGVYFEQGKQLLTASVTLVEGQQQELVRASLKPTRRWPTQYRGHDGDDAARLPRRPRARAGRLGPALHLHPLAEARPGARPDLRRPHLLLGGRTVQLGAQYYPPVRGRVRPHFGAALGRFDVFPTGYGETAGPTPGLGLGAGVDVYVGRRFSLSLDSQASFAGDATDISTWVSLGWTFGGR